MLVNSKEVLLKAKRNGYAIPSANVYNLMSIKGVLAASTEINCPLIVSLAEVHLDSLSVQECANLVKLHTKDLKQDIVLHLDHGYTKEIIFEAIDAGFTSVMFDGSSLSYEENVIKTSEIVAYAHKHNVTVEAEIGHVGSGESLEDPSKDASKLTTVEDAVNFMKDTNVNSLAISIGTAHGEYKGIPHLDFERLEAINKAIEIPLVLHGGSGSGDDNLNKVVNLGISKVNIFTDLANAARNACVEDFAVRSFYDSCLLAQDGVKEKLLHYYEIFETKEGGNNRG